MTEATSFGLGDIQFSWGDHICAIFDTPAQQMEIMSRFVAKGLETGQRCVWVATATSARSLRRALGEFGHDSSALEASGQLVAIPHIEFYLHQGLLEPDRVISLIRTLSEDGQQQGYSAMRIASDLSWFGEEKIDIARWEEVELRITEEVASLPLVMVCQHDSRQVSGAAVVAALRSHPLVIVGDTIYRSPFLRGRGGAGPRTIV